MFFTSRGQEPYVQTGQVTPAPQPRFRFPAICTICCYGIIGWGTSPACTPQLAFLAQILLPPRAIMTSAAHLDTDCPNTHHCQHKEIAVSTVITDHFLKGCSFSAHTAHWGVKHWRGAHTVVFGRKEQPGIFRTKHCYKKKAKASYCLQLQRAHWGARSAADLTSSHQRTSCKAC